MNLSKVLTIFLLVLALAETSEAFFYPLGKVTLRVIDNEGQPVENAAVTIRYDYAKGFGMGWGTSSKFVDGVTDKNGLYSLTKATPRRWFYMIRKEGYYSSGDTYEFKDNIANLLWWPWDPTMEIKLKKVKNPTKMFVKNTMGMQIPVLNEPVGYDLEKGDWVAPHGKGVTSDFVFIFKIRFVKNDDWDASYTLTFSNEQDGIQEYSIPKGNQSEYFWPYEAPYDGYVHSLTLGAKNYSIGWGFQHKTDFKENRNYIFRVRSTKDNSGKIIEAKYGRMHGDIIIDGWGSFRMEYYFNPSGTRSLEYDSNLFPDEKKDVLNQNMEN